MTDDLVAGWIQLCESHSSAKKYFYPDHPLELLYGADDRGRPLIVLITAETPPGADLSREVMTRTAQRADGRWAATWTLTDDQLTPAFMRLGVDVAERSMQPMPGDDPHGAFFRALAQWQLLLRPPVVKRLSLDRLRGLVAELWAGRDLVDGWHERGELVQAWTGPRGADQDFTFATGDLWEIKAKRSAAHTVGVSSEDQLDPQDRDLRLVVVTLDERDADTPGALSLADLVADYHAALATSPQEYAIFDMMIRGLGVDMKDPYYSGTHFVWQDAATYAVRDDFPALAASRMPNAVSKVRYQLDLHTLDAWLIKDEEPNP